jgi:hypothetical protein
MKVWARDMIVSLRWFDPLTKLFVILWDHHLQKRERYILSPKFPGESKNQIISEVRCKLHFYETKTSAEKAKKREVCIFFEENQKKNQGKMTARVELVGVAKISEAMER